MIRHNVAFKLVLLFFLFAFSKRGPRIWGKNIREKAFLFMTAPNNTVLCVCGHYLTISVRSITNKDVLLLLPLLVCVCVCVSNCLTLFTNYLPQLTIYNLIIILLTLFFSSHFLPTFMIILILFYYNRCYNYNLLLYYFLLRCKLFFDWIELGCLLQFTTMCLATKFVSLFFFLKYINVFFIK